MSSDKEYVSLYVPCEQAARLRASNDEAAQYAMIEKLIEGTTRDMRSDLEALDEDVLRFKGMLLAYKKAYTEALQAHLAAVYKVWGRHRRTDARHEG